MSFWTTTPDLLATDTPPVAWTVNGLLPEGLGILIGRPKLGKSQLALNLAVAVASGGVALGEFDCGEPGDALYCDAELGGRRVKGRLDELFPSRGNAPDLSRLAWAPPGALPRADEGLLDRLDEWRTAVPHPRLVVLDVWQAFQPSAKAKNLNAYEADSAALRPLAAWANERHLALLLVHHTRRGESVDPLEMASGSNAMVSVPNSAFVLDVRGGATTLFLRGHDLEQRELALARRDGWWTFIGEADVVMKSETRQVILDAVRDGAATPFDIAAVTGRSSGVVRAQLFRMKHVGDVILDRGRYTIPKRHERGDARNERHAAPGEGKGSGESGERKNSSASKEEKSSSNDDVEQGSPSSPQGESPFPPSSQRDFSPSAVPCITALTAVEHGDGEAAPQRAAPSSTSTDKVSADDVLAVLGDVSQDEVVLVRWMVNRPSAGSWEGNQDILWNTKVKGPALKAIEPALVGAGIIDAEDQAGEAGKVARRYRLTDAALERLAAAQQARLDREEAERQAANPQLAMFGEVAG